MMLNFNANYTNNHQDVALEKIFTRPLACSNSLSEHSKRHLSLSLRPRLAFSFCLSHYWAAVAAAVVAFLVNIFIAVPH
jgi:hypothetical protein